jgi:hypothetical protein
MSAFNALSEMKPRIMGHGQAADGGLIGSYSTKPIYVSLSQSPRKFNPLGKEFKGKRRNTFKSGKRAGQKHRSGYFSGGYGMFKSAIGRNQLGTVNLTLTGQFMNALSLMQTADGWGLGWHSVKMADRARDFEKKYHKSIFGLSPRERKRVISEMKRLITDAFYR